MFTRESHKPKKHALNRPSRFISINRLKKQNEGIAALEMAILLPLLMLFVFGIIDWGYVFYVDLSLTNAAREGARVGVTRQEQGTAISDAESTVQQYLDHLNLNDLTISATMIDEQLEVRATLNDFEPLVGFLPETALPSRLAARAIMRWEMAGEED